MESLLSGAGLALNGGQSAIAVVENVNNAIKGFIWGPIMCIVFVVIGILLSVRTGLFQVSKIKLWWGSTIAAVFTDKKVRTTSEKKAISQFQALSTALAATIGTGNRRRRGPPRLLPADRVRCSGCGFPRSSV
jgi:hypothetical protein